MTYLNQDLRCCQTCQHCDIDLVGEYSFHCYLDALKFDNGGIYEYIAIKPVEWSGVCENYKRVQRWESNQSSKRLSTC